MGLKREVMELLRQGREEELAGLVSTQPRAMRHLLTRLYDLDEPVRDRAARALGRGAAAHPELGREVVRRLLWGLNDESVTNGVYGIASLGEIGRRAPHLLEPFIATIVDAARDQGLRAPILRALVAVAEAAPTRVAKEVPALRQLVDATDPGEAEALDNLLAALGTGDTHEH